MSKKVLVIAVHPDDETLGCGGTILKHINEGDEVFWLTITSVKNATNYPVHIIRKRAEEILIVKQQYGFTNSFHLEFTTTKLEEYSKGELINAISSVISDVKPKIIYAQHPGDAHSEHKATFDAVYSCTKSFRYPYIKEVYTMETLSETEFSAPYIQNVFTPNYFVDISPFLQKKIEIMNIFTSEIGEHPYPRSNRNIKALATLRGAQAGVNYAEAFMCLKYIRE